MSHRGGRKPISFKLKSNRPSSVLAGLPLSLPTSGGSSKASNSGPTGAQQQKVTGAETTSSAPRDHPASSTNGLSTSATGRSLGGESRPAQPSSQPGQAQSASKRVSASPSSQRERKNDKGSSDSRSQMGEPPSGGSSHRRRRSRERSPHSSPRRRSTSPYETSSRYDSGGRGDRRDRRRDGTGSDRRFDSVDALYDRSHREDMRRRDERYRRSPPTPPHSSGRRSPRRSPERFAEPDRYQGRHESEHRPRNGGRRRDRASPDRRHGEPDRSMRPSSAAQNNAQSHKRPTSPRTKQPLTHSHGQPISKGASKRPTPDRAFKQSKRSEPKDTDLSVFAQFEKKRRQEAVPAKAGDGDKQQKRDHQPEQKRSQPTSQGRAERDSGSSAAQSQQTQQQKAGEKDKRKAKPESASRKGPSKPDADKAWLTGTVDQFEKLDQVGEGTFGQVYKARLKATNQILALKLIRMDREREGFPITALREIRLLRRLRHQNIVNLLGIVSDVHNTLENIRRPELKNSFYMVLEYMDYDLTGLLNSSAVIDTETIRWFAKQLMLGLKYCHDNDILHRDLKGSNLLLNHHGDLKLADFGLARIYHRDEARGYTNRVITLWYRPPELLLGSTIYGPEVDVWSAGCIVGEFYNRKPVFRAEIEIDQLDSICRVCGVPTLATWPKVAELPQFATLRPKRQYSRCVKTHFSKIGATNEAVDLLDKLLVLDPAKRMTTADALKHPFLRDARRPTNLNLPRKDLHEFALKQKRRQSRSGNQDDAVKTDSGPQWVASNPPHQAPSQAVAPDSFGVAAVDTSQAYGADNPMQHSHHAPLSMGRSERGVPPPFHSNAGRGLDPGFSDNHVQQHAPAQHGPASHGNHGPWSSSGQPMNLPQPPIPPHPGFAGGPPIPGRGHPGPVHHLHGVAAQHMGMHPPPPPPQGRHFRPGPPSFGASGLQRPPSGFPHPSHGHQGAPRSSMYPPRPSMNH